MVSYLLREENGNGRGTHVEVDFCLVSILA